MQSLQELYFYVASLPDWLSWLLISLTVTWHMVAYGFLLARTGRSPMLALLTLVPYAGGGLIWWLALSRWPIQEKPHGGDKL